MTENGINIQNLVSDEAKYFKSYPGAAQQMLWKVGWRLENLLFMFFNGVLSPPHHRDCCCAFFVDCIPIPRFSGSSMASRSTQDDSAEGMPRLSQPCPNMRPSFWNSISYDMRLCSHPTSASATSKHQDDFLGQCLPAFKSGENLGELWWLSPLRQLKANLSGLPWHQEGETL